MQNDGCLEEQLRVVKAGYLPNRSYLILRVRDNKKIALPIGFFPRKEYKRILESRQSYIARTMSEGRIIRYRDYVCAVNGRAGLCFTFSSSRSTTRKDIFKGEISILEATLHYQGFFDPGEVPSGRKLIRPQEIIFTDRLVADWDFVRGLFSSVKSSS